MHSFSFLPKEHLENMVFGQQEDYPCDRLSKMNPKNNLSLIIFQGELHSAGNPLAAVTNY